MDSLSGEKHTFQYALGFDCGATNVRVGLIRSDGRIVRYFRTRYATHRGLRNVEEMTARITELYLLVQDTTEYKYSKVEGVGIGIGGQITTDGWWVGNNGPRNQERQPFSISPILEKIFPGHSVKLDNDSKVAALGEYKFGVGRGTSTMTHLTLGTGIGGGVIIGGNLYHGKRGLSGHLGFISVEVDGVISPSGTIGDVEGYASGTAIAKFGQALAAERPDSLVAKLAGYKAENVTSPMVFEAAEQNDPCAVQIIQNAAVALGMAIVSILHAINPEVVALGGGIAERGSLYLQMVRDTVRRYAMAKYRETAIEIAQTGDNAGILGAAALTGFVG